MRVLVALLVVLMALSTKVTSFNTGTGAAGTTIDVTLGFQPKAIWVWWSGRTETTDTVARANQHIGYGFGKDSTNRFCVGQPRQDGQASEVGGEWIRNDAIVRLSTENPNTANGRLDIDATGNWPSDGIRFIVDEVFGSSLRVHIAAIGGTDITNVDLGTVALPASGTVDVTSLSYQPDIVFGLQSNHAGLPNASGASGQICFGVGISSSKQLVHAHNLDPGAPSGDGGSYLLDGVEIVALMDSADMTALGVRAALSTMLSNGFRLNKLEGAGTPSFCWMTIKGGQWDMGSILTQTDTTTDITGSPSFNGQTPALIFFESACRAESTQDVATVPCRWTKGAATGASEEAAMAAYGEDGSANTRVGTAVEHDACYVNLAAIANDGDAQTIQGSMHVTATGANSFTCRMTDADPSQSFVAWVAVAPNAGGGAVGLPFIASASQVFTPSIAPRLSLPAISAGSVVRTPSVAPRIALPTIASAAVVRTPTVAAGAVSLVLPTVASSAVVRTPTVGLRLALPTISSSTQLFAPTVSAAGSGLVMPAIASSAVVRTPTVAAGAVSLALPTVASSAVVRAPTVGVRLALPAIASSAVVRAPVVRWVLGLPTVTSTLVVRTPSVSVGAAGLQLPHLVSSAVVLVPTVGTTAAIDALLFSQELLRGPIEFIDALAAPLTIIDDLVVSPIVFSDDEIG